MGAKLRRQHPVEGSGRAAPLQVAQHDRPNLAAEPRRDLAAHELTDAAEFHLALAGVTGVHESAIG